MTDQIVVLAQADIINGKLYQAGERVRVPAGYTNARRVVRRMATAQFKASNQAARFDVGLRKLTTVLEADYPQFWKQFNAPKNAAVREEALKRLRAEPDYLKKALGNPAWFVEVVTKLSGQVKANGR